MPSDIDRVIASLRFLELRPNINRYIWRFLIQKIAYLAKALGMEIGYHFTIYVAGPYSTQLTHEYFDQRNRVNSLQTDYNLTPEECEVLERIRRCCDVLENPSLLECTATTVYLLKENPELTDDDIFAGIRSLKPYLSEYTLIAGMTKAKELLFRPEYLTEELRREIDQWDRIED